MVVDPHAGYALALGQAYLSVCLRTRLDFLHAKQWVHVQELIISNNSSLYDDSSIVRLSGVYVCTSD